MLKIKIKMKGIGHGNIWGKHKTSEQTTKYVLLPVL